MHNRLNSSSDTERLARAISKSYSKATLASAVAELGVVNLGNTDIFRALIVARVVTDFDAAVRLLAKHLDESEHFLPEHDAELLDGRVERRKNVRG